MKNNVYPCKPQFYYIKVGFKGVKNICFVMAKNNKSVICRLLIFKFTAAIQIY